MTANSMTPRALQVFSLAHKEATRLQGKEVGVEHILLGILRLGEGVAVSVLTRLGVNLEQVRGKVQALAPQFSTSTDPILIGQIPCVLSVRELLALARIEAQRLDHAYVGTEHLLLGILGDPESIAAKALIELGVNIENLRKEIVHELDPAFFEGGAGSVAGKGGPPHVSIPHELPSREKPFLVRESLELDRAVSIILHLYLRRNKVSVTDVETLLSLPPEEIDRRFRALFSPMQ